MDTPSGQHDDRTWAKQTAKRVSVIERIHASTEYRSIMTAGLLMPELPDPRDRQMPKRRWELALKVFRGHLRRMYQHEVTDRSDDRASLDRA